MTERKLSLSYSNDPLQDRTIGLAVEIERLKSRCKTYRKETRRLNEQVKYVRSLEAEILVLRTLLEREDGENADTDPSQLVPVPVGEDVKTESYDDWDMRTRFGSGGPRT